MTTARIGAVARLLARLLTVLVLGLTAAPSSLLGEEPAYRIELDSQRPVHVVTREKDGKSLQFALAMGDLDGDGLDDLVFADSSKNRLRVFFQEAGGDWKELDENDEPVLSSPGQHIRLADLNGDGRLDIVLSQTVTSSTPGAKGGWSVFLNTR